MGRVQDKVAIVTGGASGVGKADCILLAREGARVVVTDIDEKGGNATADEITKKGGAARFIQHDVASEGDWQKVIAFAKETFGGLDVLVNNAAILAIGTIEDTTLELYEKIQRINSTGVFLGCKYGYAAMKEKGGSIVNMSSISGIGGSSSFCAYSASKGAVTAMTRSIAAHSRFHGINVRCNSIHPDGIMTPMVFNLAQQSGGKTSQVRLNEQKQVQARFSAPEDIANLVLFLASDESKRIQGAEMRIDNGYLMWAD